MRIDSFEFNSYNKGQTREPRFVVELSFDSANTDIHYLTSHPISGLTGNIINDTLEIVSSTSQKLNPEKANSTIGTIKFKCLDIGLTALQKTKLDAGNGLKGKRVRVYVGFEGLTWDKFVLVQTQIISDSITYKNGVYTFSCADVQRLARKKLFVLKETALTLDAGPDTTTLTVQNTSGFEVVYQPPLNGSVAPGQEVGFLKIEHNETFSIVSYTGKTGTTFTGVTQGILGTPKLDITVQPGETGPKVEEFVYISAPAIMVAYALLTGSLYGYPGKFLPDHWHLGISTDYVKTSDFVAQIDLWDTSDIDAGIPATVQGVKDKDGKKFIEEQLYYMLGLYSPVRASGELGLKRLSSVLGVGGTARTLDDSNVASHGELKFDLKALVNRYVIKWNYSLVDDRYTRSSVFIDSSSITKHGESDVKVLELRNLYGSGDSARIIFENFENLRTRTASPPLRLDVECVPDQNDIEVGDIVTVNLTSLKDLNNPNEYLYRNFEVQEVSVDWVTGTVKLKLFGSSEYASPYIPDLQSTINTAFLTKDVPTGQYITPANFGAAVTSSGGLTRVVSNITLTGNASMRSANSVWYCPEDLQIDDGVTVTISANTRIHAAGYITINGTIDGKGNGHAGATDPRVFGDPTDLDYAYTIGAGTPGGCGVTVSQGGLVGETYGDGLYYVSGYPNAPLEGSNIFSLPNYSFRIDASNELRGLPDSLIGTSGGVGGAVYTNDFEGVGPTGVAVPGGAGGASGAGLVVIGTGIDIGDNGLIDLSGDDGQIGPDILTVFNQRLYAGSGAGGHPGGLLFLPYDSTQFTEVPSDQRTRLNHGISPDPNTRYKVRLNDSIWRNNRSYSSGYFGQLLGGSARDSGGNPVDPYQNRFEAYAKVVFIDALPAIQEEEEPSAVEIDPTFTLTEQTNTPVTPQGNRSTIEVSVTPPADSSYSYSVVDYRESGQTAWTQAAPASNESLIPVDSDGKTYEVRVRAVSKTGVISQGGEIKTITVLDRVGRTDVELASIFPFAAITNLGLDVAGTVFTGAEPRFKWDHDNGELAWFNFYEVQIYSGATLLRTEQTTSPTFVYSYNKNRSDYFDQNAALGVYFDIEIRVKPVSLYFNDLSNLYSGSQVTFTATASTTNTASNLRFLSDPETIATEISDAAASASWNNIGSLPARFSDTATQGINVTDTHLGFYDSTNGWQAYIDNTGKFLFRQDASNYMEYDGTNFVVRGDILATSVAASASISAPIITGGSFRTAVSGQRAELLDSDNKLHFYWDSGDGTVRENVEIGGTTDGGADYALAVGSSDYQQAGVLIRQSTSATNWALFVSGNGINSLTDSLSSAAVRGVNQSGNGLFGYTPAVGKAAIFGWGENGEGVRANGSQYDFYAEGSGTNYGPFTGAHDALIPKGTVFEAGDIMKITGVAAKDSISNILAKVEIQDKPIAKDSYGVIVWTSELLEENTIASLANVTESEYQNFKLNFDRASVNGVGEGQINVCSQGGDISVGDFITTSSTPGKGMRCDVSDLRVVVAKALESVVWENESDTKKQIACIYMCG